MSMTYTSLVNQIQSELNRSDTPFIQNIPNFISNAEQRIARESKNIGLEVYVDGNLIVGNPILQKPARWRRTLSFYIQLPIVPPATVGNSQVLYLRGYDYLRVYWPNDSVAAAPIYYADYGYYNWLVAPTPDLPYPFEIGYLQLPEPITISNQTNWLTDNAPDVLLYAALLEAVIYLKDDARIAVFQGEYEKRIDTINKQDDQRMVDRVSNRGAD